MAAVGRLVWYTQVLPSTRLFEMGSEASVLCRVLKVGRHSTLGG